MLHGIRTGYQLNLSAIEEDVQRRQGRIVMPAFIQTMCILETFEYLEQTFKAAALPLSTPFYALKTGCLLLPSALAYTRKITYLYDRIVPLCILATAVSSVALIALGQVMLGATTLTVLGVGVLCRRRILPYPIRSFLDKTAFLAGSVTGLILNGLLWKIKDIAEILLNLNHLNQSSNYKPSPKRCENVSWENIAVCPDHLLEDVPECSEDLKELSSICQSLPFLHYEQQLSDCFSKSEEWIEFARREESAVSYDVLVKEGISRIEKLLLRGSEPKEYDTLKKKLQHIIGYLKEAQLKEQVDVITRLGVSAYGYSGSVIWAVDEIYSEKIASKEKVKHDLQKCRDLIVDNAIDYYFDPLKAYPFLNHPWLKPVADLTEDFFKRRDKHNYYLYINILAPNFGLTHSHGARTDQMALSEAVFELGLTLYNRRIGREIQAAYTKERILEIAQKHFPNREDALQHLLCIGVYLIT